VIGTKIINADRNVLLSLDCLHKLESLSYCRDIPNIKNFKIGDPVCSVMVESSNITQVKSLLSNADSKVSDLITYNNKHLKLR
jgi:predicted ATP-grasp superfamily ATP-dependent carboligase